MADTVRAGLGDQVVWVDGNGVGHYGPAEPADITVASPWTSRVSGYRYDPHEDSDLVWMMLDIEVER